MSRIWMPGGAGGADADVVTAEAGDVLKGKVIVGPDGEPLTGTLALSGDAGDSVVLSGKTYYNTDPKQKRTGTMTNQGAKTAALNCGGSYTIPAGYHNGQGKVTANSLAAQTGVQSGKTAAGAGHILTGYEAWVNGGRVTGTMANQGTKNASLNCGGSYTIPAGYHNGQGKVTANALSGQTDATAAAGDILTGKTAWVKGSKITGTMGAMNGGTYTPAASAQTISCSGKKMNSNIVINAIPSTYVPATANQTVFNNGVCRLIKRVYPYLVCFNTVTNKWEKSSFPIVTGGSGASGQSGFSGVDQAGDTNCNYYGVLLDGTIDLRYYKTLEISIAGGVSPYATYCVTVHLINADKTSKVRADHLTNQSINFQETHTFTISFNYNVSTPLFIAIHAYAMYGKNFQPWAWIYNVTLKP